MDFTETYNKESKQIRAALAEAEGKDWAVEILEGPYVSGGCRLRFGPYKNRWQTNPHLAKHSEFGNISVRPIHEIHASRELLEDTLESSNIHLNELSHPEYLEGPMRSFYRLSTPQSQEKRNLTG